MGYSNLFWTCPYYKWDEKLSVHCEGGSKVVFNDQGAAKRFFTAYCTHRTDWNACCIAQARNQFYEGREAVDT